MKFLIFVTFILIAVSAIVQQKKKTKMPAADASLLTAAVKGKLSMAYEALSQGAQIDCRDGKEGNTPLILAARHHHLEMAEFLLDRGAKMEVLSLDGEKTPLLVAAFAGDAQLVQLLLFRGANVETTNQRGDSPLLLASHNGNVDIVRLLLSRGANVNRKTIKNGYSALYVAASAGYIKVVEALLEQHEELDIDLKSAKGVTPLICAINRHNVAIMEKLVDAGADLELRDGSKRTPLLSAITVNCVGCVEKLVEHGADVEKKETGTFFTPLMRAASLGHHDIMKILIERGDADLLHTVPRRSSGLPAEDEHLDEVEDESDAVGDDRPLFAATGEDGHQDAAGALLPEELTDAMERNYSQIEVTLIDDTTNESVVTTPQIIQEFVSSSDDSGTDKNSSSKRKVQKTKGKRKKVDDELVSALSLAQKSGCKKCAELLEAQLTCSSESN